MATQLFARPMRLPVAGPVSSLISAQARFVAAFVATNDGLRHAGLISLGLASFIVVLKLSGV